MTDYPYIIARINQQLIASRRVFVLARRNGPRFVEYSLATRFTTEKAANSWMQRHRSRGSSSLRVVKVEAVQ